MEFVIPGLTIFLIALAVAFFLAPRATPLIAAILSIVLLTYGVYDHYSLFAGEYKLSTWQDGLKIYAPFLMIGMILVFCIYGMVAFFTNGSVPVPAMPSMPSMPSLSSVANSIGNRANNIINNTQSLGSSIGNSLSSFKNKKSFSFAEVI